MTVKETLLEMDQILHLILQTADGWTQLEMLDSVIEKAESIEHDICNGSEMLGNMRAERKRFHAALNKSMN